MAGTLSGCFSCGVGSWSSTAPRFSSFAHSLSRPEKDSAPERSGVLGPLRQFGFVDNTSDSGLCIPLCRCVCPVAVGYVRVMGWRAAPPIAAEVLADVSWLGCSPYKRCVSVLGSFVLWCLAGTNVPSTFWRCILHGRYSSVSLPGRVGRIFSPWSADPTMSVSDLAGPVQKYVDDYYSRRSSNDNDLSEPMGLSSLGVVDLDTSIIPDVFGLRAFAPWEPISLMLRGQFKNTLWVLVTDAAASPVNFHDIVLEDYAGRCHLTLASLAVSFIHHHA